MPKLYLAGLSIDYILFLALMGDLHFALTRLEWAQIRTETRPTAPVVDRGIGGRFRSARLEDAVGSAMFWAFGGVDWLGDARRAH